MENKEVILRFDSIHCMIELNDKIIKDIVYPKMKIFCLHLYLPFIIMQVIESLGFSVKTYYEN